MILTAIEVERQMRIRELISSSTGFLHIASPSLEVIKLRNFFCLLKEVKEKNIGIKLFVGRLTKIEKVLINNLGYEVHVVKGIDTTVFINDIEAIVYKSNLTNDEDSSEFARFKRGNDYENLCLNLFLTMHSKL